MAVRDCFIDYDRELTVVAEVEDAQGAEMVGIAHLIHYANRETAEFAVAVGDALRGRGLGSLLAQYCIDVARDRGIREIVADMLPDNEGIIALLRRKGFRISPDEGSLRGVLAL
jgi:acetyltransferase